MRVVDTQRRVVLVGDQTGHDVQRDRDIGDRRKAPPRALKLDAKRDLRLALGAGP